MIEFKLFFEKRVRKTLKRKARINSVLLDWNWILLM